MKRGGERPEVEASDQEWMEVIRGRGKRQKLRGVVRGCWSDQSWRQAIRGGGKPSSASDQRWMGAIRGGGELSEVEGT